MKKLFILAACFSIGYSYAQGQISLERYLSRLDSVTDKTFYYKNEWIDTLSVNDPGSLDYINQIKASISNSGLRLHIHKGKHVFIYPNRIAFERQTELSNSIDDQGEIESIRIGNPDDFDLGKEYMLNGSVTDESGQPLVGANILVDKELVALSDGNGVYSLSLKPGNYALQYSYVGKESEERLVTFYSKGGLDVSLFPGSRLLDEVVIEGSQFDQSDGIAKVGVQKISVAKLEKLPSFLGDVDVVKSSTALPGVSVSGESSSYLNVRGGGNDQTLVLMNNTTIYNPGHMLGFFSVFNGDFVSGMTLYKGNIPAKYGMRASSVLDVKMDKWATKKLNVYGGLGIANSNLGVKSKLLEDKLDLHVGGRASYVNWILDLIPDVDIVSSRARFGDVNFSSRYKLDEKNTLFSSLYYGSDYFNYSNDIIYKWRTLNGQAKWTHLLTNDWVLESEFMVSSLRNSSEGLQTNDKFLFKNGISEYTVRSSISNNEWELGVDLTNYRINGGERVSTSSNNQTLPVSIDDESLLNLAAFSSYRLTLDNGLEINPGLRLNYYMNFGPDTIDIYQPNTPYQRQNITGQESIASGEIAYSKVTLEPRLGINYVMGANTFRAGYSRINQFMHLIANTVLINPATVWKGVDRYIPNTTIDQYSLGYQYDIKGKNVSLSVDGFYKKMKNAIDYRDGATLLLNNNLEQEILRGEGNAYGLEFLVSKNTGLLSGLISYTYSRSFITVNDQQQEVSINRGDRYPAYSDRPHSVKASIDYKLTKKWTFSSNFIYSSGAPINAPVAIYEIDNKSIPLFSDRNAERIPDYHRLDLVITVKSRVRKTKKNNDRWVLTLYNVYGRDNVATIFFSNQNDRPSQAFKLINVGRIVPTLTYKFEF